MGKKGIIVFIFFLFFILSLSLSANLYAPEGECAPGDTGTAHVGGNIWIPVRVVEGSPRKGNCLVQYTTVDRPNAWVSYSNIRLDKNPKPPEPARRDPPRVR